jgi:alpha-L-rhamnosidase
LRRCDAWRDQRGLLDIPDVWNFVDWTTMDMPRSGVVTSTNVLYVRSLREAARMAEWLGDSALAAERRALADRVAAAVNAHCWSEERGAYVDALHDDRAREHLSEPTNTLALLCGVVPDERCAAVQAIVERAVEGNFRAWMPGQEQWGDGGIAPVGSPWFLFFTCEALHAAGRTDLVLRILREQWRRMLDLGATSFWETFPALGEGGHWSRSLCHGWSAAPAYFLSRLVLGVRPLAPGQTVIEVAPHTVGLQWAKGTVPTPLGDVRVAWRRRDDGGVDLDVTAPQGIEVITRC